MGVVISISYGKELLWTNNICSVAWILPGTMLIPDLLVFDPRLAGFRRYLVLLAQNIAHQLNEGAGRHLPACTRIILQDGQKHLCEFVYKRDNSSRTLWNILIYKSVDVAPDSMYCV